MLKCYLTSDSKKDRNINLKQKILVYILSTFLLLSFITAEAQDNINKSPALESLLQQIDKNYVPQKLNKNIDEIAISIPFLYVQLVGSAMRNQKSYLKQNPASLKIFENLNKEILSIIPQIADAYNKTNYNKIDYEYNDALELKDYYYRALDGIYSQNFKQNYREFSGKNILQVNIPFILDPDKPNYIKKAKKDNAIVLLGVEAPPKSSPHELQGPFVTGLKCPLKYKSYLQIDTNNNPDDRTHIGCFYNHDNDLLYKQEPLVNGFKHGEYFYYSGNFDKVGGQGSLPHRIINRGYYNNAKKDGIWERYKYYKDEKKILLRERSIYKNDSIQSHEDYYPKESYQSSFVKSRSIYIKGKRSKSTYFYENGQVRMLVIVYPDGTSIKEGCWEKDGTKIPCPSYW